MDRTDRRLDLGAPLGILEHRLLLPIFDAPGLGRDDIQFFLDLGVEGLAGTGPLFLAQGEIHLDARQALGVAIGLTWLAGGPFLFFGQLYLDLFECSFRWPFMAARS